MHFILQSFHNLYLCFQYIYSQNQERPIKKLLTSNLTHSPPKSQIISKLLRLRVGKSAVIESGEFSDVSEDEGSDLFARDMPDCVLVVDFDGVRAKEREVIKE